MNRVNQLSFRYCLRDINLHYCAQYCKGSNQPRWSIKAEDGMEGPVLIFKSCDAGPLLHPTTLPSGTYKGVEAPLQGTHLPATAPHRRHSVRPLHTPGLSGNMQTTPKRMRLCLPPGSPGHHLLLELS